MFEGDDVFFNEIVDLLDFFDCDWFQFCFGEWGNMVEGWFFEG